MVKPPPARPKESAEITEMAAQLATLEQTRSVWKKQGIGVEALEVQVSELQAKLETARAANQTPLQVARAARLKLEKAEKQLRMSQEASDRISLEIKKQQELFAKKAVDVAEAKALVEKLRKEVNALPRHGEVAEVEQSDVFTGLPEALKTNPKLVSLGESYKAAQEAFRAAARLEAAQLAPELGGPAPPGEDDADVFPDMDTTTGDGGKESREAAAAAAASAADAAARATVERQKTIRPSVWLEADDILSLLSHYGVDPTEENVQAARNRLDEAHEHAIKKQRV